MFDVFANLVLKTVKSLLGNSRGVFVGLYARSMCLSLVVLL